MNRVSVTLRAALAASTVSLLGLVAPALGQTYPTQDIHIIGSFPAGSGADLIVRYFAEKIRIASGRTTIVENKVGASGNIATQYVARSKADGYTILIGAGSGVASATHLFKIPPVDALNELQVVATTNSLAFMIVVPERSPYRTLSALSDGMRVKGDKATYAHSNTTGRVTGELYKLAAKISAVDVPYRTALDSLNDFESGSLDFGVVDAQFAITQSQAGKMRMLAVNTPARMQVMPEIPTLKEQGIPVGIRNWFAAIVPAKTPRPIVDQLNKWINDIEATDETRKFLATFAGDPMITTPDEAQQLLADDLKAWEGYVRDAKIPKQE